jgi:hypothetical protein
MAIIELTIVHVLRALDYLPSISMPGLDCMFTKPCLGAIVATSLNTLRACLGGFITMPNLELDCGAHRMLYESLGGIANFMFKTLSKAQIIPSAPYAH